MPYDSEGNYLESHFCEHCGFRLDAAGDCPSPWCPRQCDFEPIGTDEDVVTAK